MLIALRLPDWPAASTALLRLAVAMAGPAGIQSPDNDVRVLCVDMWGVLTAQAFFEAEIVAEQQPALQEMLGDCLRLAAGMQPPCVMHGKAAQSINPQLRHQTLDVKCSWHAGHGDELSEQVLQHKLLQYLRLEEAGDAARQQSAQAFLLGRAFCEEIAPLQTAGRDRDALLKLLGDFRTAAAVQAGAGGMGCQDAPDFRTAPCAGDHQLAWVLNDPNACSCAAPAIARSVLPFQWLSCDLG